MSVIVFKMNHFWHNRKRMMHRQDHWCTWFRRTQLHTSKDKVLIFSRKCRVADISQICRNFFQDILARHLISLVHSQNVVTWRRFSTSLVYFYVHKSVCSTEATEFLQVGNLVERQLEATRQYNCSTDSTEQQWTTDQCGQSIN